MPVAPYYAPGGGLMPHLGQATDQSVPGAAISAGVAQGTSRATVAVLTLLGLIGAGLSAYHGFKRSGGKTGAAVGWGVLGLVFPIITVPVALIQGYAKPKVSRNYRTRRPARRRSR